MASPKEPQQPKQLLWQAQKIHNNTNNFYGKPKDPQQHKQLLWQAQRSTKLQKNRKDIDRTGLTLKPLVEYPEKTTNLS